MRGILSEHSEQRHVHRSEDQVHLKQHHASKDFRLQEEEKLPDFAVLHGLPLKLLDLIDIVLRHLVHQDRLHWICRRLELKPVDDEFCAVFEDELRLGLSRDCDQLSTRI